MAVAVLRDKIKETLYIIRNIIFAHNTFNAGKETQQTFLKSYHTWWLQNLPGIALFPTNTEQYDRFKLNSFKIVSLCNYKHLPATVKLLATFLEAIL